MARVLSAIKTFYHWLDDHHGIDNPEIAFLKGPKRQSRLPRPVSVAAARDMIETAEANAMEPWVAARDAAVLTLLYGAGLRISEALSLNGAERRLMAVRARGNVLRNFSLERMCGQTLEVYRRLLNQA